MSDETNPNPQVENADAHKEAVDNLTNHIRTDLADMIEALSKGDTFAGLPSSVIAEIVLARRHLEDARMRLGVAQAYIKGINPWESKVAKKEQ